MRAGPEVVTLDDLAQKRYLDVYGDSLKKLNQRWTRSTVRD